MTNHIRKPLLFITETVGSTKNSITGEIYSGVPRYYAQRLYDGKKIDMHSFAPSRKDEVLPRGDP